MEKSKIFVKLCGMLSAFMFMASLVLIHDLGLTPKQLLIATVFSCLGMGMSVWITLKW